MSQHDYNIANASGATVRTDLNNVLGAIATNNSGASAPSTTYAYQWWADTTTGLLKIRNAANTNWITVGTLATTGLALLALTGGSLTGALELDAFEDVASAATCNIGAATSNFVRITGATGITGFGTSAAGVWRILRFASTPTITYNAVSMILPGVASITAAANDCALAISLGSGSWIVVIYQRAAGTPVITGLQTPTLITSAAHSLTNANNGAVYVFQQSCALLLSRPGSLSNGWSARLINMAPNSLTPITITASFFVGSGSQVKLLGQPGLNTLDVFMVNSLYFTSRRDYVSDVTSILNGTRMSFTHALGGRPLPGQCSVVLRNVSAELGFEVGDEVLAQSAPTANSVAAGFGANVQTDDTSIHVEVGGNGFYVHNETTLAAASITANSWRLYVRAWY